MSQATVVQASAGAGKTTRLVRIYLDWLRRGLAVERIIAITFTRRAAAELVERLHLALTLVAEPDSLAPDLRARLHALYHDVAPQDPDTARRARASLPAAPIGTTDSFVASLLTEFALEAHLAPDSGDTLWLDLIDPTHARVDTAEHLLTAATEIVDPLDPPVATEVAHLLEHLSVERTIAEIASLAATDLRAPTLVTSLEIATELRRRCADLVRAARVDSPTLGRKHLARTAPWSDAVEAWIDADMPGGDAVPWALVPYLAHRGKRNASGDLPRSLSGLQTALDAAEPLDLGAVALPFEQVLATARAGLDPDALHTAARLARAAVTLARRARRLALELAVADGALGYELLLDAAIATCLSPDRSARLRSRFDALLVDEAQDANPAQARLYRALEALPGDARRLRTVYVGDTRQSIYRFRGAEPRVFGELVETAEHTGHLEALPLNRRSSPALVAAQRALFGRAAERGLDGVASLDEVGAARTDAATALVPVCIVAPGSGTSWSRSDTLAAAIDAFYERLCQARRRDPMASAAVLAPTWREAASARDRLRARFARDGARDLHLSAALEGQPGLADSRVLVDVRTLLQALWEPEDDIAWLGLWRHPMVGLTDGAIALLRLASSYPGPLLASCGRRGLLAAGRVPLSLGVHLDVLPPSAPGHDQRVFARVVGPLREAVESLGRLPTAAVLERLIDALHGRAVLEAGPDGQQGLAELEVTLDWIRTLEAPGIDPPRLLAALANPRADDAPGVRLVRDPRTVLCTTIYQAKGLEWDHVCVCTPGASPGHPDRARLRTRTVSWTGQPAELVGVRFDPRGGLDPVDDPGCALIAALDAHRQRDEELRLTYVALTRARETVTFGLSPACRAGIHRHLCDAWLDTELTGVEVRNPPPPPPLQVASLGWVEAVGAMPPPVVERESGWTLVAPSHAAAHWPDTERDPVIARLGTRLSYEGGGDALHPPPITDIPAHLQARPAPDAAADTDPLAPWAWGELVHGWFAAGGLLSPAATAARAHVARAWPWLPTAEGAAVADWLVALSRGLPERIPGLWTALTAPGTELAFEWPLVGVDGHRLHIGRCDLLVRPSGMGGWWVVDFKAGAWHPTPNTSAADQPHLVDYLAQLETYRRALEHAGEPVERVGLVFVRQGIWASSPVGFADIPSLVGGEGV